jgi:hypothetical protein
MKCTSHLDDVLGSLRSLTEPTANTPRDRQTKFTSARKLHPNNVVLAALRSWITGRLALVVPKQRFFTSQIVLRGSFQKWTIYSYESNFQKP